MKIVVPTCDDAFYAVDIAFLTSINTATLLLSDSIGTTAVQRSADIKNEHVTGGRVLYAHVFIGTMWFVSAVGDAVAAKVTVHH